jgi:hypothetical protein
MNYGDVSRSTRPLLFLVLGILFLTVVQDHFTISNAVRIPFGIMLIAYAIFRFIDGRRKKGTMTLIASLLILSGCQNDPGAKDVATIPVILVHSEVADLVHAELEVFRHLYPNAILEVMLADTLTAETVRSEPHLSGFITHGLPNEIVTFIEDRRIVSMDSSLFIISQNGDGNDAGFRIYDFEAGAGPVRAFSAFLTGQKGQLIAHKKGFKPAHAPTREVYIEQRSEGLEQ